MSGCLAGYITCLSSLDPAAADLLASGLPAPKLADAEAAEARLLAGATLVAPSTPSKQALASKTSEESDTTEAAAVADEELKRKRKRRKKKKSRLPKDLDKPIDAERWLPVKQRSYYIAPIKKAQRGKKGRIGGAGGHQVCFNLFIFFFFHCDVSF